MVVVVIAVVIVVSVCAGWMCFGHGDSLTSFYVLAIIERRPCAQAQWCCL